MLSRWTNKNIVRNKLKAICNTISLRLNLPLELVPERFNISVPWINVPGFRRYISDRLALSQKTNGCYILFSISCLQLVPQHLLTRHLNTVLLLYPSIIIHSSPVIMHQSHQSIPAVPCPAPPLGNCRAFARLVSPRGWGFVNVSKGMLL